MAKTISNKELFANWMKRFESAVVFDNLGESKQLVAIMADVETQSIYVEAEAIAEQTAQGNPLVTIGRIRASAMDFPITGMGLQIVLLSCKTPSEAVMALSYAKVRYEAMGGRKVIKANAAFAAKVFPSTIWTPCFEAMWEDQILPDGSNLLDKLTAEDYA
jgi:hypothetical protein